MKKNKVLILALSLGLLTAAILPDKVEADNVKIEQCQTIDQVKEALNVLQQAKAKNLEAYENAVKRVSEKNFTNEDKLIIEKHKELQAKTLVLEEKLKNYKEEKPDEPKKPEIKTERKTEVIPFKTFRKHNIQGAKTMLKDGIEGKNGYVVYELTYEDGKLINKKEVEKQPATDQTILTQIKIKDEIVETKEVEDKSRPIYRQEEVVEHFVYGYSLNKAYDYIDAHPEIEWTDENYNKLTNSLIEEKLFNSYGEAQDYAETYGIIGNYGDKITKKNILVGYETKTETKVIPAVYAWE